METKLLFICGSLESGRDGVGDYTRYLALALQRYGNTVHLLATHDKQVTHPLAEEQSLEGNSVSVLRLPYVMSTSERQERIQQFVDAFTPDWISLQYVPHAYNKYGIPLGLLTTLRHLRSPAARHVMFHELWITPKITDLKGQIIQAAEKLSVRWLCSGGFSASLLHTQLPAYVDRLKKIHPAIRPLPLFANVPVVDAPRRSDYGAFQVVFFSQLATPPPVVTFLITLRDHLRQQQRELKIELLGGGPARVETARLTLAAALPDTKIAAVGFLEAARLSTHLAGADLGITPVPHHLIGKSGTVAAFLSHRLAVAAPVVTVRAASFFAPSLNKAVLTDFSPSALDAALSAAAGLDVSLISVDRIAGTLARDMNTAIPTTSVSYRPVNSTR